MKVKRYKHRNITIQRTEPMSELSPEERNVISAICLHVEDMELLGNPGCIGNYEMCQFFYNAYTDRKYAILLGRANDLFAQGKVIRLHPEKMTKEDYEEIGR